jgi:hypothetical protein
MAASRQKERERPILARDLHFQLPAGNFGAHWVFWRIPMETSGKFFHRTMPDSTIESVCMKCFQTIVRGKNETEIVEIEKAHSCTPLSEVHQRWRVMQE